jgi:hypothetical protein
MRTIEVSHQRYNGGIPFEIQSSAKTFGEFKTELSSAKGLDITMENRAVLTSHGEINLSSVDQELPEGNLSIMITPKTMKAGVVC